MPRNLPTRRSTLRFRRRTGQAQAQVDFVRDLFFALAGVDAVITALHYKVRTHHEQVAIFALARLELAGQKRDLRRHRDFPGGAFDGYFANHVSSGDVALSPGVFGTDNLED